jgi:hypothetical protein
LNPVSRPEMNEIHYNFYHENLDAGLRFISIYYSEKLHVAVLMLFTIITDKTYATFCPDIFAWFE